MLAIERVPKETVSSYGIIDAEEIEARRLQDPSGREAAAQRSALGPRDHRPLCFDPGHLSRARSDRLRSHRRDPTHQRSSASVERPSDLRLPHRRRPPRHREQTGIPQSRGLLCASSSRSRRRLPRHLHTVVDAEHAPSLKTCPAESKDPAYSFLESVEDAAGRRGGCVRVTRRRRGGSGDDFVLRYRRTASWGSR